MFKTIDKKNSRIPAFFASPHQCALVWKRVIRKNVLLFVFFLLFLLIFISMPYFHLSRQVQAEVTKMLLTVQPISSITSGGETTFPIQSQVHQFKVGIGGTFNFANPDGSSVTIIFFIGTTQVVLDFFIDSYEQSVIIATRPLPVGHNVVGSLIYDMRTFEGATETFTFNAPFSMTVSYTDALVANFNEETLNIYFWNESQNIWETFASSTLNTLDNTITIFTNYLTLFATLGEVIKTEVTGGAVSTGGGGIVGGIGGGVPTHINAFNVPLKISPNQSGTLTQKVLAGNVVVDVPKNNVVSKTIFSITEEPLVESNSYLISIDTNLINGVFYYITAKDENGNPVTSFPLPITISFPIPEELIDIENLGVYFFDEVASQWVLIPRAALDLNANTAVFQVNNPAKFAIFEVEGTPSLLPVPIISSPASEKETLEALLVPLSQADINQDGKIDIFDFNLLMVHWGVQPTGNLADLAGETLGARRADIDSSGVVNIFDFNQMMVEWTG